MWCVLCHVSNLFFGPALFIDIWDASCLTRVNLSCIQDTEDTRYMQPCVLAHLRFSIQSAPLDFHSWGIPVYSSYMPEKHQNGLFEIEFIVWIHLNGTYSSIWSHLRFPAQSASIFWDFCSPLLLCKKIKKKKTIANRMMNPRCCWIEDCWIPGLLNSSRFVENEC